MSVAVRHCCHQKGTDSVCNAGHVCVAFSTLTLPKQVAGCVAKGTDRTSIPCCLMEAASGGETVAGRKTCQQSEGAV